ncbi:MAG: glycosyltransferase [Gammaproteobacteria bacterium]|nr:glycosyltransferase [Gammaproteobacteria bacterium]
MKIHIISNNPIGLNSGFGIVARNLGLGFKRLGHNVSFTGLQTSYVQSRYQGMTVYPGNYFSIGIDSPGQIIDSVKYNLYKVQPDAVICIFQGDDGRLNSLTKLHKNTFWYCPIEGKGMPTRLVADMSDQYIQPVFMTQQGASEFLNSPGMSGDEEVPIIYHGYDPNTFYKIDNPPCEICKWSTEHYKYQQDPAFLCENGCLTCSGLHRSCEYFELEEITLLSTRGEEDVPYSDLMNIKKNFGVNTVFLFVGQNFGVRKRIERLIEAFAKFAEGKDDVLLHLHTSPFPSTGINLITEVQKHGIVNKVVFSYGTLRSSGWSDEAMNLLYNSADIFVSASSAEGFGLPHLESMAVGLPQIVPDFSVFPEFITEGDGPRGLLCKGTEQLTITGQSRVLVDIDDMASRMDWLYCNTQERVWISKNALKWASNHTWDKKCDEWDKLITGA